MRQRVVHTAVGLGLLGLGIVAGHLLRSVDLRLVNATRSVIAAGDSGRLLVVATQVTALNTLRVLPLYLGAFVLMEEYVPADGRWTRRVLGYLVPALLVPLSYQVVRLVGTPYDFGVPAMLSVVGVILVHALSLYPQGLFFRAFTFGMFSFGWQWLGMAPRLTGYGFGMGDLSVDVKNTAAFLGQEALLNQWSVVSCGLFVGIALVMAKFMVDYRNHLDLVRRHQAKELELRQAAARNLEARSRAEMQRLVHDLKTPLTTVQGLLSLIAMTEDHTKTAEYVERVVQAVERMNHMISEILHPETRRRVSGGELVRMLHSHVSGAHRTGVRFETTEPLPGVEVNVVRTIRAMANLIQNARDAMRDSPEPVLVRVSGDGPYLRFEVIDQGPGIPLELMDRLFTPGFSTKGSSGLGLSFAREVIVQEHGGTLDVESEPGRGTTIVVKLPGGLDSAACQERGADGPAQLEESAQPDKTARTEGTAQREGTWQGERTP
ncbi:MAG TPA: HAMP domain-containing sensor histidine kinase [Limnochordales bacterium]